MLTSLAEIDRALLIWINGRAHPVWLDRLMLLASEGRLWALVTAVALIWALFIRRWHWLKVAVLAALALALSDAVSHYALKQAFKRNRPCHEATTQRLVPTHCGGNQYGFPSNHAANGMAVATIIWTQPVGLLPKVFFLIAALIVGFSRIYLGVHYPADVLFGFLVGGLSALVILACRRPFRWSLSYP